MDERRESVGLSNGVAVQKPDKVNSLSEGDVKAQIATPGISEVLRGGNELNGFGSNSGEQGERIVCRTVIDNCDTVVGVVHPMDGVERRKCLAGSIPIEDDN